MSSQNVASSFPLPPEFYKRYTDENLDKLKRIKEHGIEAFTSAGDTLPQDFDIFDLEPPKVITKGSYTMFNEPWPVVDRMRTLEENDMQQLYPKGEIDKALELKKLNNSVVFNFVELLDILVKDPDRGPDKCEQIKLLLINMKFLLNEYRPHQRDAAIDNERTNRTAKACYKGDSKALQRINSNTGKFKKLMEKFRCCQNGIGT
ncbi:146_t:CDS:2 [Dentiscutata erythropus]|uniref:Mediator of RNA polymerase II transcription subunit 7 n=1 Tax=Dentiscutata erythropus TaxID=1348616 RepID=A0A9N9BLY2_9GLOM|nr:146_t:CDS:2 [Dentiscutata erythropus]